MNISIPEDQIQEVVSTAILKHLNEEQRTAILESAVASLLKKPDEKKRRDPWAPDPKSPLQEAFEIAVRQAAISICQEMIVEGPYREKVEAAVREALEKVFAQREAMVEQVAKSFSNAIADGMRYAARYDDW